MDVIEITIFTAKFVEYDNSNVIIIDVMIGENMIQRRSFYSTMVKGIKNPDRILIGVKIEPGYMTTTFKNGNRYHKLFKKCGWND
jgi:hypothetical protein